MPSETCIEFWVFLRERRRARSSGHTVALLWSYIPTLASVRTLSDFVKPTRLTSLTISGARNADRSSVEERDDGK
jgi:hypothetical protein